MFFSSIFNFYLLAQKLKHCTFALILKKCSFWRDSLFYLWSHVYTCQNMTVGYVQTDNVWTVGLRVYLSSFTLLRQWLAMVLFSKWKSNIFTDFFFFQSSWILKSFKQTGKLPVHGSSCIFDGLICSSLFFF